MPKILVVEDEPAIAESISYSLRRDGFTVTVAPTLAVAEREAPHADLVILDLMLPDGSGFDLIGQIRRGRQSTAIIVLSSRDGEADRVAALETGADDAGQRQEELHADAEAAGARAEEARDDEGDEEDERDGARGGDDEPRHGTSLPASAG